MISKRKYLTMMSGLSGSLSWEVHNPKELAIIMRTVRFRLVFKDYHPRGERKRRRSREIQLSRRRSLTGMRKFNLHNQIMVHLKKALHFV
jgi:hypothetical protein